MYLKRSSLKCQCVLLPQISNCPWLSPVQEARPGSKCQGTNSCHQHTVPDDTLGSWCTPSCPRWDAFKACTPHHFPESPAKLSHRHPLCLMSPCAPFTGFLWPLHHPHIHLLVFSELSMQNHFLQTPISGPSGRTQTKTIVLKTLSEKEN